jgi:hypothetical protein
MSDVYVYSLAEICEALRSDMMTLDDRLSEKYRNCPDGELQDAARLMRVRAEIRKTLRYTDE